MINFCAANADGEIVMHGLCGESELDMQFCPGAQIYALPGISGMHYVSNGELFDLPPQPSGFYKFDYTTKQWVVNAAAATESAILLRSKLLAESDWTQLPDVPLATKSAWATYRQALRDITDQPGYPLDITWPTPPGASS